MDHWITGVLMIFFFFFFFTFTDARGLQFKQPAAPSQNSRLVIFDENKEHPEPQELKLESWASHPTAKAKENEQKPDKWANVKVLNSIMGKIFHLIIDQYVIYRKH